MAPRPKTAAHHSPRKAKSAPESGIVPESPVVSPPTPPVTLPVSPPPITPPVSPPVVGPDASPSPTATPAEDPSPDTSSAEVHQLASIPTETTPTSPASPDQSPPSPFLVSTLATPRRKLPWVILLIVALLAGLGVAGFAVYNSRSQPSIITKDPEPTSVSTVSPTLAPTSVPKPDRTMLKVQVLNGSGTPGAASVAKDLLERLGYIDIATGNADSYDYDRVEISLKPEKSVYFELLAKDLSGVYTVASEAGTLESGEAFDASIVIGQK